MTSIFNEEVSPSEEEFKSRYHESRIQYMATGKSPTCKVIYSDKPYWQDGRLIFPFLVDNWQHFYFIDFPSEFKPKKETNSVILIGIAMAEIYRLCEICTPEKVKVRWYSCLEWESQWWNEDIYWYLQQKFYLEKWDWQSLPRIEFAENHIPIDEENNSIPPVNDSYLLAVGGGKESTFAFEWMKRAKLPFETFTLHNAGGILGHNWLQKFPVFNTMKNHSHLWEILAHPKEDPAEYFDYQGVRNDPTITNALFLMMIIAADQGHRFLVMANDRSSNESNTTYSGRSVNHQSAKGSAYIKRFNDFLERKGLPFKYISICEEIYSISTVYHLSIWNQNLLKQITSCNEAQWAEGDSQWCCRCPKCAFSYALIEAVTNRRFAIEMVGEDLFRVAQLEDTWRRLFDPKTEKPFECVGAKRETLMALIKCKENRLKNNEPLGILAQIPDLEFDKSLLDIYAPKNIPDLDRNKLEGAINS